MADAAKLVHVRVYASGVFGAKVADVWEAVRNYGQAEAWLTGAQGVRTFTRLLPGQVNCQIGALRLVTIGQASYVDQLDALDDVRHVMKYKLISHPLNTNPYPGAFLNFRAVIRLHGVTRGNGTFLEWTGDFDTEPQDSPVMRAAIAERLEAGFQGLELLFARPPPPPPAQQPPLGAGGGRPVGATRLPPHAEPAELSRGVAAMGLRHTASMPAQQAQGWPPPNRSPRTLRAEAAGAGLRGPGGMQESHSGSSLASSPHHHEAAGGPRPGSGSAGQPMPQWTSGGSTSTIHLSTIPARARGEQEEARRQAAAASQAQAAQQQAPQPAFAGWLPDGPAPAHFNPTSVPSAAHVQGAQLRQANLAADLFQRYQQQQGQQQQARARQQGQAGGPAVAPAEAMDVQPGPLRQRFSSEGLRAHLPASRSQPPPQQHPMQEAEPAWPAPPPPHGPQQQQQLPEAWAGGTQPGSRATGAGPSGRGGPDNDADWARIMQQREDDLRQEAHLKQARSPGKDRASFYGQAGPFGAAAMLGAQLPGSAFAGGGGGGGLESRVSEGRPLAGASVRRTASHTSLAAMSHTASGVLDRSAGSVQSLANEEQVRRQEPARSPFQQDAWESA